MSGDGELEIDQVSHVYVRWTIDTRHKPDFSQRLKSSEFQYQYNKWQLCYYYDEEEDDHVLLLNRTTRSINYCFNVSVKVKNDLTGLTVKGLSEKCWVKTFGERYKPIWRSVIWSNTEADVFRAYPEFGRRSHELQFLVELKEFSEAVESKAAQTEDIVESSSVHTNPACLQSLSQDLSKMLEQASDLDVEFQVAGESIKAHGFVVSARSDVIAAMLSSNMVEGNSRVVKIPDGNPHTFTYFLRYIYSGQLPVLTVEIALALYESADKYAVLELRKRCSEFLVENLSVQNCCRILVTADAHSDQAFRESVIGYMLDWQVPLHGEEAWRDFCEAHMKLANKVLNRFCLKLSQNKDTA